MKLFGSRRRTQVLLALALLEESHASELAAILKAPLKSIQRILLALESEGVIEAKTVGREKRISISKRFVAEPELRALLLKLAIRDREVDDAVSSLRRRPRLTGKAL